MMTTRARIEHNEATCADCLESQLHASQSTVEILTEALQSVRTWLTAPVTDAATIQQMRQVVEKALQSTADKDEE